jgi:glycerol-3-phosphate acyltransferase PlsY
MIVVWTAIAYMLGCINGAYYLHRRTAGTDIRTVGTGNPGARNTLRVMGKKASALVFLIDAGKGTLAVVGAMALGLGSTGAALAAAAAVAGHIFPAQLGLRGGKGIATAFGAAVALQTDVALVSLALAAILLVVLRRPAFSGTAAVVASPIVGVIMNAEYSTLLGLSAIAVLAVVAHRADLPGLFSDRINTA